MKNIIEYITEGKQFTLKQYERSELGNVIGFITGNIGDEDDIAPYKDLKDSLSKKELKQLDNLFDLLDDEETWPKINKRIIKDDIPLIIKCLDWADEEDLIGNNWDLMDAYDKIKESI